MDFKKLAEPFPASDIEWRAGATNKDNNKAMALAYVTSRAVMDRLDEVCGPENWRNEFKDGPDGGVICGLSIRVDGEWITKWDGADNTNFEAVKGGLSGAMKRAGVQWGVGRYLYKLDGQWVKCTAYGKTVKLDETPKLPAWALPVVEGKQQSPKQESKPTVKQESKPAADGSTVTDERPLRLTPDKLKAAIEKKAAETYKGSNPPQTTRGVVVANLEKCFSGSDAENKRHEFLNWLTGRASIKDVDGAIILALKDWLNATQDSSGDWQPDEMAGKEANAAVRAYEVASGQQELI
jgi:hypothetical protein